jgi:hypothetical protein
MPDAVAIPAYAFRHRQKAGVISFSLEEPSHEDATILTGRHRYSHGHHLRSR